MKPGRLVLLGGGHAHVRVLAALAERPLAGWEVWLATPYRRQIYSGMLPGWIAGRYPIGDCSIDLEALAARANAVFVLASGAGLDPERRILRFADGTSTEFDLLSVDTGPVAATASIPGADTNALPIRPIEGFVAAWPGLAERIRSGGEGFDLAILGGGAAGVELALAIGARASTEGWRGLRVSLVGTDPLPLDGAPDTARRRAAELLSSRGVAWRGPLRATRVDPGRIAFDTGPSLEFDACVLANGAAAPAWPAESGLATDRRGFIRVDRTLRSVSHAHVFAAGDVAAYVDPRPKSGVYAVRAGPVLAANLRAACEGRPLARWTPQKRALYLISAGDGTALANWGPWTAGGRWAWRWKDWIDRRFMARFAAARDRRRTPGRA